MQKHIVAIKGDGIGPEIVTEAIKVLEKIAQLYDHDFRIEEVDAGGVAIDKTGLCLPQDSLDKCLAADSVLLGAVGGPKWDQVEKTNRPEQALLRLRSSMGLYANLRPARMFPQLRMASPLAAPIVDKGFDFLVVRELIGGVYFGAHTTEVVNGQKVATDIMSYSESEIERIARTAFEAAGKRDKKVMSVDKANVLDCSRLWREVVTRVGKDYPDIALSHMYVDNCAMQMVGNPSQFDVIVTENLFGDVLSDEASMITGSIGMIPSASLDKNGKGMYEPIHGSAPDIAGKNVANPIGAILSAGMMLLHSFGLKKESEAVERAVSAALDENVRTADIMSDGCTQIGCGEMGEMIVSLLE